jgi:hypothetical protein
MTLRRVLAIVLVASAVVFLVSASFLAIPLSSGEGRGGSTTVPVITAITSLCTAILSLTGLVATTVLGVRKDQRESRAAELERRKQALDIEKLQADIAALQARPAPAPRKSRKR